MVFHSRERAEGMCTEGSSIRVDTSLSARASRLSVFVRRPPTPNVRTKVAGTTRTSWPAALAWSAMRNDSAAVSRITRQRGNWRRWSPGACVSHAHSNWIVPAESRTQIWAFLPPTSIAQWSMAGSFTCAVERAYI